MFVFKDREFRANFDHILGGVVIGLVVVAGWYVTGHLGYGENPDTLEKTFFATNTARIESFSFVAPLAYTLELLMLWTDKSLRHLRHRGGRGVVAGLAPPTRSRRARSAGRASRRRGHREPHVGGILMGFGGVTALGCTIGQGHHAASRRWRWARSSRSSPSSPARRSR